jgi:hypothetical protein
VGIFTCATGNNSISPSLLDGILPRHARASVAASAAREALDVMTTSSTVLTPLPDGKSGHENIPHRTL